jgi:hypothetical protein
VTDYADDELDYYEGDDEGAAIDPELWQEMEAAQAEAQRAGEEAFDRKLAGAGGALGAACSASRAGSSCATRSSTRKRSCALPRLARRLGSRTRVSPRMSGTPANGLLLDSDFLRRHPTVDEQAEAAIREAVRVMQPAQSPTRARLIEKGLIYSPAYGLNEFTVPHFDTYMRRRFRPANAKGA